jgi:hypothetical protein
MPGQVSTAVPIPPGIGSSEAAAAGLNGDSIRTSNTLALSGSISYNGDLRALQFHGQGEMKWGNGGRYVGEFCDGQMRGRGVYYWGGDMAGQVYEGQFDACRMHGHGQLTLRNGASFNGEWQRGRAHGQGVFVNKAETYRGAFENGARHGQGLLQLASGDVYEGEFAMGKIEGNGSFVWKSDGSKYTSRPFHQCIFVTSWAGSSGAGGTV